MRALERLGLSAENALAVEGSAGLRAAMAAGLATVVVAHDYTANQDFTGAAVARPGSMASTRLSLRAVNGYTGNGGASEATTRPNH